MRLQFSIFLFLFAILTGIPAQSAVTDPYLRQLQLSAQQKHLWDEKAWLNLGHYVRLSAEKYSSPIRGSNFFVSKSGPHNPQIELQQTISAFFQRNSQGNRHAQCKYIARLHWLTQRLNIDLSRLPAVNCSDYLDWRKMVQAQQVTLVFPAYYLNSPSSMFGHTLLRLDPIDKQGWSDWLSFAVNFGADIDANDNSFAYAYKGLTGGYPGRFNVMPYFKKIKEYNRTENRDIWEYRINLSASETERLVTHLWELKNVIFDYYFFDENCSYRLLELLEVARPEVELTDSFKLTAVPVDTVRAIGRAGMIESVTYRPSQATVLNYAYQHLQPQDQPWVIKLAENPHIANSPAFMQRKVDRRHAIVDTAYKYLRYQKLAQKRDAVSSKNSYQLLALLNSYPVQTLVKVPASTDPPENSHRSKRFNIGLGEKGGETFTQFGLRMVFHDLIDNTRGFLRGAQINMGNLQIRADSTGDIGLYRLDVIDIFSLTPRTPLIAPLSWRVRTGLESPDITVNPSLVPYIDGGAGVAYDLVSDGTGYALLTGRVEANRNFDHRIEPGLGFAIGFLYHAHIGTARIELNGVKFTGGTARFYTTYEQNLVLSRNHALTLAVKREQTPELGINEIAIRYQYFFD